MFGAQVRKARELRGWTQERLRLYLRDASGIDLSSTAMARLEQGKRPIRLNEVAALADLLNISLSEYEGGNTRPTEQQYSAALRELAELFGREFETETRLKIIDDRATDIELERMALMNERAELRRLRAQLTAVVRRYKKERRDQTLDEILDSIDLDRYPSG